MRDHIITILTKELATYPFIHALWLEGADTHKRADQYSDIDVWIDADDDAIEKTFEALEKALGTLGNIDTKVEQSHDTDEIFQRFYHLADTLPFLLLDVCVQKHSREITLNTHNTDEKVIVLFDKDDVLRFIEDTSTTTPQAIKSNIKELAAAFSICRPKVEKHIKRGHFLSALHAYHHYVLEPLVVLMRLQADPTKKDFYLKHVETDLPPKDITVLIGLYKVDSLEELSSNLDAAEKVMTSKLKEMLSNDRQDE